MIRQRDTSTYVLGDKYDLLLLDLLVRLSRTRKSDFYDVIDIFIETIVRYLFDKRFQGFINNLFFVVLHNFEIAG